MELLTRTAISISLLTTLISCDKVSVVENDKNFIRVYPDAVNLHKDTIVDWMVGPKRNQKVSKGVRVSVKLPRLDAENLDQIIKRFEVDSWVIKVRKVSLSSAVPIGQLYYPISIPGRYTDQKYRRKQMPNAVISLYYTSASISKRYERLPCPAFNHSRRVTDIEIRNSGLKPESLFISIAEKTRVPGKVQEFGYDSNILNAGKSLEGEYEFEFALYNSETKFRMSNYIKATDTLFVRSERNETISGCENFEIPKFQDEGNKWDQFRFKR